MLVSEFKEKEGMNFDERFLDILPETCFDERCGAPMEMSDVLTNVHCSNPRCPSKVATRMVAMMSKLGVKGFAGKGKMIDDCLDKFGFTNPLIIFAYEPEVDGSLGNKMSLEASQKIYDQLQSRKDFTLAEFVRIANLPFIQTSALNIFGDYDSLEDAYKDIEEGGVDFIRRKLSIQKGAKKSEDELLGGEENIEDISVRAIKVYESLMTFKNDLFQGIKYVNIIKTHVEGMRVLKVKCTEEVGAPYKTKAEFYAEVNKMFENRIHVEFVDNATKDLDYLVWAGVSDPNVRVSRKVEKVRKWNQTYIEREKAGCLKPDDRYIPIVDAKGFINTIYGLLDSDERGVDV